MRFNIAARKRARRFVLQALYQWQINPEEPRVIAEQFLNQVGMVSVDQDFFKTLFLGVINTHKQLDSSIQPFLDQSQSIVQPVELAILRMGCYEMHYFPETAYRVILNESIELAKAFGADSAHKYVNGVLHQLATHLRISEFSKKE